MQDFRKRRNPKAELLRAALNTAGVIALGVAAFVAVRGAWGMYQKFAEAGDASSAASARLAGLEAQYAAASSSVADLSSPRGVEGQLRERYGVAKPGEGQITIVRQASSSGGAPDGGQNWFERLWHALFVW